MAESGFLLSCGHRAGTIRFDGGPPVGWCDTCNQSVPLASESDE